MYINQYLNIESMFRGIKHNFSRILPLLFLVLAYFFDKRIFIFTLVVCLDIIKHFTELYFHIAIPIYPFDYGIIIMSYLFSPLYGFYLIIAMFITRILLLDFKTRHLVKLPILVLTSLASFLLRNYNLSIIGPIMFSLRYVIEYFISLLTTGSINTNKLPVRIINILFAALCFIVFF